MREKGKPKGYSGGTRRVEHASKKKKRRLPPMLLCIGNYSFWWTEILFEKQRKETRGCVEYDG